MAFRSMAIGSTDPRNKGKAKDAPIILARSILSTDQAAAQPRWGSSMGSVDLSVPTHEAHCAADGFTNRATYIDPSLDVDFSGMTSATDLYLIFQQYSVYRGGTSNCADAAVLWLANLLDVLNAGITFTLDIADDPGFTSRPTTICQWNAAALGLAHGSWYTTNFTQNARVICYDLMSEDTSTQAEYEDVQNIRLHFNGPVGIFATIQPQVLELWLGPMKQLSRQPHLNSMMPELALDFDPIIAKSEASSGQRADLIFAESRTSIAPSWDAFPYGTDAATGIDDQATLLQAYRECRHGTRSFIFAPNPNSRPEIAYLYKADSPKFGIKRLDGIRARSLSGLKWDEQPPFVDDEQPDAGCEGAGSGILTDLYSLNFQSATNQAAKATSPTNIGDAWTSITFSFWIRQLVTDSTLQTNGIIFDHGDDPTTGACYSAFLTNHTGGGAYDRVELHVYDDQRFGFPALPGELWVGTIPTPLDMLWHHIRIAWKGAAGLSHSQCIIAVDGIELSVALSGGVVDRIALNPSTATPLSIGNYNNLSGGLKHVHLAQCAIFNDFYTTVMNGLWLYNAGHPRNLSGAPNLKSWWRWQLTAADAGPNGNTAPLQNGLPYVLDHP